MLHTYTSWNSRSLQAGAPKLPPMAERESIKAHQVHYLHVGIPHTFHGLWLFHFLCIDFSYISIRLFGLRITAMGCCFVNYTVFNLLVSMFAFLCLACLCWFLPPCILTSPV